MTTIERVVLTGMSYLLTGVALVGYDLSAPPLHRKMYVIGKRTEVALLTVFLWPLVVAHDVREEARGGGGALRLLLGVVLLAGAVFLWARLVLFVTLLVMDLRVVAFPLTFITVLFVLPIITAITMPKHGR